jgi:RimJ/RimL family protein N-acetyltransferase
MTHTAVCHAGFMASDVLLRDVCEGDLQVFFQHQRDPAANHMAAFAAKDPADWDAFATKWTNILGDDSITKKTILFDGRVAGSVVCFVAPWSGQREVSYWIGREFWGRGIATLALAQLLGSLKIRPIYARAAKDNIASMRVLQKCGFTICGLTTGFANARGTEIEEVILQRQVKPTDAATVDRVDRLSDADLQAVQSLSLAVYPPGQLADWPGRHVEWSAAEWCVRVRGDDDTLASYLGVYVRDAQCDSRLVRIGGIGNVKTHPTARRRGLASLGMGRAIEFLRQQPGVAFALLVCESHLLAYYARLGWREFGGRLLVKQRGAQTEFTFNRVMTHPIRSEAPADGTIDLCGPPW